MRVILYLEQIALLLQIFHNGFSCFIAVHACIFAAVFGHGRVIVHYFEDWQIVAASYLIVVRVMRRGNFNNAGTEFHINILVADNRDFSVEQRENNIFAD